MGEVSVGESADFLLIKDAVKGGWVVLLGVDEEGFSDLVRVSGIHSGEAEAVFLARQPEAPLIADDREASSTARVLGVRCMGTVGVLLLGLAEGVLELDDFIKSLHVMMDLGFRLSAEVYRKAVENAETIAGEKQN